MNISITIYFEKFETFKNQTPFGRLCYTEKCYSLLLDRLGQFNRRKVTDKPEREPIPLTARPG